MKTFWIIILWIIIFVALFFWLNFLWLFWKQTFGVWNANIDRKIFEQSQSYNEGMRQELNKYRLEYQRSDNTWDKQAISTMLLNDFANVDRTQLNPLDRQFLDSLEK